MFRPSSKGRTSRLGCFVSALAGAVVLACTSTANAGSIVDISGGGSSSLEGLGSFTGSIEYSAADVFSTTGTLVVTLTNTSAPANGGFITGLLFNIGGGDSGASATLASGTHPFTNCTGGGLSGSPFGTYDAGAALGGSFLGGGSPNPGIAVGGTGVFTFDVSASDAGTLTALDFLNGGSLDFNFLVRFRGFEDGGSDKVGAVVVPLPPALGLGLAGFVCAAVASARKKRRDAASAARNN